MRPKIHDPGSRRKGLSGCMLHPALQKAAPLRHLASVLHVVRLCSTNKRTSDAGDGDLRAGDLYLLPSLDALHGGAAAATCVALGEGPSPTCR